MEASTSVPVKARPCEDVGGGAVGGAVDGTGLVPLLVGGA
jgi:hypothetical protein